MNIVEGITFQFVNDKGGFELVFESKSTKEDEMGLLSTLSYIYWATVEPTFFLIGVDCEKVKTIAHEKAHAFKKTEDAKRTLQGARKDLLASIRKPELLNAATRFFYVEFFSKLNHPPMPKPDMFSTQKFTKKELKNDVKKVVFIANFSDWKVVKKLHPKPTTPDYEFGAALCSIHNTIGQQLLKNAKELKIKKSSSLSHPLMRFIKYKQEIEKSNDIEKAINLGKMLELCGFPPYPDLEMLIKAYPQLKIPKPRGRKPKK